ncbi:MAG: type II secretion system F family protein [Clostridia bacterium]|nr:type II secretion system F family protein [Candidatus Gastranaerophilales bacterium]MBQ3165982.1 type II secretion system F family protein [Clostridia bacterium]
MATFFYAALKDNKTIVKGRVEAQDAAEARRKVRDMNLIPTSITSTETQDKRKGRTWGKVSGLSLKEKIDFTSTLEILTSTGIPIIEALLFVEQNSDSARIRNITHDFRSQIIAGATLGEALEKYRNIFGRVYIGLVKAGEDSGELDKTLIRMLELLKKQDAVKGKVIGALIYPAIVVLLAFVAIIIMLVFVFPAFDEMFNNLGKPLPPITKMCMSIGVFMKKFWVVCISALVFAIIGINQAYQYPPIRRAIDAIVLRIPLISDMMKFSNFSNFIAVLQVSYEAGIPIVDCLFLANLTMDNHLLKTAIMQVATKVQQGTHLSVALKSVSQVPTMMTFMIATGEQSGRLGDSLYHCVNYIDKKLDAVIDGFTKIIEPLLMVFIGVLVGFMGLALYLPLFQAYQQ